MTPAELRQEAIPGLVRELWVLSKLAFDHEFLYKTISVGRYADKAEANLDAVNGMDVLHAVENDPPNLLQGLIRAHDADSVSLHKDVALSEKLNCLATGA